MFGSLGSSLVGGVGTRILADSWPSFLSVALVLSVPPGVPRDLESLSNEPPIPPGRAGRYGLF